jgi:hypothetical protein
MAGVELRFGLDWGDFYRLKALPPKARIAGAKALTFTAKDAQAAVKVRTGAVFHLRNAWVPKGIRIKPASAGSMVAQVGSIDKYMARHVIGAGDDKAPESALSIRRTRDSRGRLASGGLLIKPYGSIGDYPTHTRVKSQLGRVDRQRRKTFQIVSKSGNQVLVVRRTTKKRYPLQTLSILRGNAVDIKERFDMVGIIRTTVKVKFPIHFERAIGKL